MNIFVFLSRILKCIYGYEAINILFRISPSFIKIKILRQYGAKIGDNVRILNPFMIHNADENESIYLNLKIGDNCFIGRDCIFDLKETIEIGNNVTISHRVVLNTHTNAGNSPISKTKLAETTGGIKINDGAYIGSNVTILESVIIGYNTIIGASSLLNKNIPDGVTAFGVPCKIKGLSK